MTESNERAANFDLALNTKDELAHAAADAFWEYWRENGETHKHGYYESTWGAINRAIRLVGVCHHPWQTLRAAAPHTEQDRTTGPVHCAASAPDCR